jgi:hypothetical protein
MMVYISASKKAKTSFKYLDSNVRYLKYPNPGHSVTQEDIRFNFRRYHIQLHFH